MKRGLFIIICNLLVACAGVTPAPVSTQSQPTAGQMRISPMDGMEQVFVPSGEFKMGTSEAWLERTLDDCHFLEQFDPFPTQSCKIWIH